MTCVETYDHAGVRVRILLDDDPRFSDPRDHDNISSMYCWHPDYELGDEQFTQEDHDSMEDVAVYLRTERNALVILPLFLLDHSGLSIRAGANIAERIVPAGNDLAAEDRFIGDGAGWDTTMVGFIYAEAERVRELCGDDPRYLTTEWLVEALEMDVREYDKYLRGEVYGYIVGEDTPFEDSCWGFLGFDYVHEQANESAESVAESLANEQRERAEWAARDVVTCHG